VFIRFNHLLYCHSCELRKERDPRVYPGVAESGEFVVKNRGGYVTVTKRRSRLPKESRVGSGEGTERKQRIDYGRNQRRNQVRGRSSRWCPADAYEAGAPSGIQRHSSPRRCV
jgi:hypothetical protein